MPPDANLVPCAVFAFNRPDKLKRVLSALKTQGVDHLIVFVDGPRNDADVELVERCKAIARGVDWVDKGLHFGEQNRGLPGLSDNVSVVLNKYQSAVFVEDDCLPMPGFYSFMRQALAYYEQEQKVFAIGGYQPLSQEHFQDDPHSLMSVWRFMCWGWATWRDRWELISPYLLRYWELFDHLENVPDMAGEDVGPMARACAEGRLRTWDVQVAISMLWLQKVQLLPTRGLVRHIGADGTGIHKAIDLHDTLNPNVVDEGAPENIVWLEDVQPNGYYTERLKRFVRPKRSIHRTLFQKLGSGLRQVPFLASLWRLLRRTILRPHPERLIERKVRWVIASLLPGRFPRLYSTLDGPMEVPVQVAAYQLATRKYIQPGDRVLDVGFGLGYGMRIVAESVSEVAGIEVDRRAVKYGMNIVRESSKIKEVLYYNGYDIPYPDNSFDVVACIDVLEHVPDYMRLLQDMCRVSRRVVLLSTPNRRPEYTQSDGRPKNWWHLREWSKDELESILKQIPEIHYEWNFINGSWEGPFEVSESLADNTLALTPALLLDAGRKGQGYDAPPRPNSTGASFQTDDFQGGSG